MAAGVICFFAATSLKRAFGYDDSLDAFGVHGIGRHRRRLAHRGFCKQGDQRGGRFGAHPIVCVGGVGTTVIYGFAASFILLKVIDMTIGLRVTEEQEREGLDISLHGESLE